MLRNLCNLLIFHIHNLPLAGWDSSYEAVALVGIPSTLSVSGSCKPSPPEQMDHP